MYKNRQCSIDKIKGSFASEDVGSMSTKRQACICVYIVTEWPLSGQTIYHMPVITGRGFFSRHTLILFIHHTSSYN